MGAPTNGFNFEGTDAAGVDCALNRCAPADTYYLEICFMGAPTNGFNFEGTVAAGVDYALIRCRRAAP